MNVATLGPKGTFSHEAVLAYDKDAAISFERTIWDVFDAVDQNKNVQYHISKSDRVITIEILFNKSMI